MTAGELAGYVGRTGEMFILDRSGAMITMRVPVTVKDARQAFGRTDLLVSPVGGTGESWVSIERVRLDVRPPAYGENGGQ